MVISKAGINFTKINDVLQACLSENMNKARIKLMAHVLVALCKVQTVNLHKLAQAFETQGKVRACSSMRRLQRFLKEYALDTDLIARLVMKLVPVEGPCQLAIDRTEWDFGKFRINILALGIVYKGCAFPILYMMLPKKGNSNTSERIALIDRFIRLFGREAIGSLLADREFVGQQWVQYLKDKQINYFIRIRESFIVHFPNGDRVKASRLFQTLQIGEKAYRQKPVIINGLKCYLTACRVKGADGKSELQLIISYHQDHCPIATYKNRWQIETMFKAMKTSGFNLEKTHLKETARIEKLFALVMLAYTWAYKVGIYLHEKVREIPIKKHGRRAKSFVKYGLDFLAEIFLNPFNTNKINVFQFLSCT